MLSSYSVPIIGVIQAGWPSPAEEELIDQLSFDEWLVAPNSFMVKVDTEAMQDAGIHGGDIVIFKRGKKPVSGDIVVASVDNEWLIRYYQIEEGKPVLYPANGICEVLYPDELTVIGVISAVIRKY